MSEMPGNVTCPQCFRSNSDATQTDTPFYDVRRHGPSPQRRLARTLLVPDKS